METYSKDTLISDKQDLLQFVAKLQQYLNKRKAEGYPPRLDYAADFTRPFVTDLKSRVANIQKYVEAEADFGFVIEICQHTNLIILAEAKGCYIGYPDTRYLAEGINEIITILCPIEKRICGAVLGSMIQSDYWHIYGDEIIRGKDTPRLEEKRPIPTTILQIKLNAAEVKCDSVRSIPDDLNTGKAQAYFKKAEKAKLLSIKNDIYKWEKTKALLAYFAMKMSGKLKLNNRTDQYGKPAVSWKPFEELFGVKDLKNNYNNINQTTSSPKGSEIVDGIFAR